MSCTNVQNLIMPYLDGDLSKDESNAVEDHVQECRKCARDLDNSQYLSRLLKDNLDLPEAPKDLREAVIETVAEPGKDGG